MASARPSAQQGGPFARFDDLVEGGPGLVLEEPLAVFIAERPAEVAAVLQGAEKEAARGRYVAGFVSYEAAAALGGLPVTDAQRDVAPRCPLAWFTSFDGARQVPCLDEMSFEPPADADPWQLTISEQQYRDALTEIHEQIAAGQTYQCNFTVPLLSQVRGNLFGLYRDLALAQRSAHSAYLDTGELVVASASPELFFDWHDESIVTRPMKGTARRAPSTLEDARRATALRSSAKERAENVMIVDLLRNDLGRLAEFGSVEVPELFMLERYEGLWQMTSTVTPRPRPEVGLLEIFEALFPSGSVTGAPKRATMEITSHLESSPRGLYCGAIGLLTPDARHPRARFSVAIRTAVVDRATGAARYGAGGGITWGSNTASEFDELLAKTDVLSGPGPQFALIETTAFRPGSGLVSGAQHLARLESSARYFSFAFDRSLIDESLEKRLAHEEVACRVRLLLDRHGELEIATAPLPPVSDALVRLALDDEPVDVRDRFLFHKTTRREHYDRRLARHPEADDVVLQNTEGEVTETTIANLAVLLDGRWWTPPLSAGLLPGIERARLLADGSLVERSIAVHELYAAEAVALVSSLRGWRPATLLVPARIEPQAIGA